MSKPKKSSIDHKIEWLSTFFKFPFKLYESVTESADETGVSTIYVTDSNDVKLFQCDPLALAEIVIKNPLVSNSETSTPKWTRLDDDIKYGNLEVFSICRMSILLEFTDEANEGPVHLENSEQVNTLIDALCEVFLHHLNKIWSLPFVDRRNIITNRKVTDIFGNKICVLTVDDFKSDKDKDYYTLHTNLEVEKEWTASSTTKKPKLNW